MLLSDCVLRHVIVTLMTKLHLNPLHYLLAWAGLVGCPSDLCISLSAHNYISFTLLSPCTVSFQALSLMHLETKFNSRSD